MWFEKEIALNSPKCNQEIRPEIPIPPRHRPLARGESIRRGDKVFHFEDNRWIKVGEELRGTTVPEKPESGRNHYCRPTHPLAQDWYVDRREGQGSKNALGGPCSPFDTLENAREAIEKRAEEMDRQPFGMIRDHRGSPLFAYDPPEPPPASNYYATRPKTAPVIRGAGQPGPDGTDLPNNFTQNGGTKAHESMKPEAEEPCEASTFLDLLDELEEAVVDLLVETHRWKKRLAAKSKR